jgi:hypothetical protein
MAVVPFISEASGSVGSSMLSTIRLPRRADERTNRQQSWQHPISQVHTLSTQDRTTAVVQ